MMLGRIKTYARALKTYLAVRGPYRFLFKRLTTIDDLDLLARALATDCFRETIEPIALPFERFEKILILAPHQDDETIGCGGLMARWRNTGTTMHALYITDGREDNMPGRQEEDVVRIRRDEAKRAMHIVGAKTHEVGINNLSMDIAMHHVQTMADTIADIRPDLILVPWLFDAVAKHRLAGHLLYLAHRLRPVGAREIWGYQAHNTILHNGYVDITEVMDTKRNMLRCYESQNRNYRPFDHISEGIAAWNSRYLPVETGRAEARYAELFFTLPTREYMNLLAAYYLDDLPAVYKKRDDLVRTMSALQCEIHEHTG